MAKPKRPNSPRRRAAKKRARGKKYKQIVAKGLAARELRKATPKPTHQRAIDSNDPRERALKRMKAGSSLAASAKAEGISVGRLRSHASRAGATYSKQGWRIRDMRPRRVPLYTAGDVATPSLSPDEASRAAAFMSAVGRFLTTGDESILARYRGKSVRSLDGKRHAFETDENTLYELDAAGEASFPEIYRILG